MLRMAAWITKSCQAHNAHCKCQLFCRKAHCRCLAVCGDIAPEDYGAAVALRITIVPWHPLQWLAQSWGAPTFELTARKVRRRKRTTDAASSGQRLGSCTWQMQARGRFRHVVRHTQCGMTCAAICSPYNTCIPSGWQRHSDGGQHK